MPRAKPPERSQRAADHRRPLEAQEAEAAAGAGISLTGVCRRRCGRGRRPRARPLFAGRERRRHPGLTLSVERHRVSNDRAETEDFDYPPRRGIQEADGPYGLPIFLQVAAVPRSWAAASVPAPPDRASAGAMRRQRLDAKSGQTARATSRQWRISPRTIRASSRARRLRMPCFRAFIALTALPPSVFGPLDRAHGFQSLMSAA